MISLLDLAVMKLFVVQLTLLNLISAQEPEVERPSFYESGLLWDNPFKLGGTNFTNFSTPISGWNNTEYDQLGQKVRFRELSPYRFLRKAIHSDFDRIARHFDQMHNEMFHYFDQSFYKRENSIHNMSFIYDFDDTFFTVGPSSNDEDDQCTVQNSIARTNFRTIKREFELQYTIVATLLDNQYKFISKPLQSPIDHFNMTVTTIKHLSSTKNHTIAPSTNQKLQLYMAEFVNMAQDLDHEVGNIFYQATKKNAETVTAFEYNIHSFERALEGFQPQSWDQCYMNYHALDGMIYELLLPSVFEGLKDTVGAAMKLRKDFIQIAMKYRNRSEYQLQLLQSVMVGGFDGD